MKGFSTTVKGDKVLKARLAKMSADAIGAKHALSLMAGAQIIRNAAVRNIHTNLNKDPTGNLARSIEIEIR